MGLATPKPAIPAVMPTPTPPSVTPGPPGTVFEAFRSETVLERFPCRIDALCWWHETLLVGLQDGSLLFVKLVLNPVDGSKNWQVCGRCLMVCGM